MKTTGAYALIKCLQLEGVEVVFGYPGGAVLSLYDALYNTNFPHIRPRHEQGAVHAADGYARATGKVGVCIATSGPGATNLITGIATAYMDSIPLLAITGQVTVPLIGRDSFQEADIKGITTPITKHNYLVKDVSELPRVMKEAFYILRTGRPGPVLIDIAKDIFDAPLEFSYPEKVNLRGYKPVQAGDEQQIKDAYEEILQAEKPLLFIGGGINLSDTAGIVRKIVAHTGIPVVTSLMGKGCFPDKDPLNFGMIGMHGTFAGNMATTETDLLLGMGVRFDDRVTGSLAEFAPKAKIIHFDIDPAEVNKNVKTHLGVVADLRWSLNKLYEQVVKKPKAEWEKKLRPWQERLQAWKKEKPLNYKKEKNVIMPQEVIETLSSLTDGEAIIVTDVGQHQMWTAQFFDFKQPRSLLSSGGLGTMGYGVPAAIGAKVGKPEKEVICICGDGGFMMNCQELATIADLNLPVKIIILNNQSLGMVAQWQRTFYERHYSHSCTKSKADFVKISLAMGVPACRVESKDGLRGILERVLKEKGPYLVEIRIPEEEDVVPMVPSGMGLDKMILGG
ncbi:MAG: biosynthetic-type acetolactate synthase large subunit [Desulfitobacteriia bacterium]|jgi:acetolactate synthase-1/2/3 large subunit